MHVPPPPRLCLWTPPLNSPPPSPLPSGRHQSEPGGGPVPGRSVRHCFLHLRAGLHLWYGAPQIEPGGEARYLLFSQHFHHGMPPAPPAFPLSPYSLGSGPPSPPPHLPGSWRVSTGNYSGGDVMSVLVAALIGGFSAGQVGVDIMAQGGMNHPIAPLLPPTLLATCRPPPVIPEHALALPVSVDAPRTTVPPPPSSFRPPPSSPPLPRAASRVKNSSPSSSACPVSTCRTRAGSSQRACRGPSSCVMWCSRTRPAWTLPSSGGGWGRAIGEQVEGRGLSTLFFSAEPSPHMYSQPYYTHVCDVPFPSSPPAGTSTFLSRPARPWRSSAAAAAGRARRYRCGGSTCVGRYRCGGSKRMCNSNTCRMCGSGKSMEVPVWEQYVHTVLVTDHVHHALMCRGSPGRCQARCAADPK